MKIRFQADNDFRFPIVSGVILREAAIDFQSAATLGLDGVPDKKVLSMAADEGRILVTHDRNTMPRHFREFVRFRHSPGVFLISQRVPIGEAVAALVMGWSLSEAEEWENQLVVLPSWYELARGTVPRGGSA
jgi:predicted nuclease of predicted toxin-antitoxin system